MLPSMFNLPPNQEKVFDIYSGNYFLMERTNRYSLDGVNFPCEVPYSGLISTQMSLHWMKMLESIVPNHIISSDTKVLLTLGVKPEQIGRVALVKHCIPIPLRCVVRGHYTSSSYDSNIFVLRNRNIPNDIKESEQLPFPFFVPFTNEYYKGEIDFYDMNNLIHNFVRESKYISDIYKKDLISEDEECSDSNVSYEEFCYNLSENLCKEMTQISLELYNAAYHYARNMGIIIAETMLNFGLDEDLNLTLIGEAFTPKTTRFWDAKAYKVGTKQIGLDEQCIRDFIFQELKWNWTYDIPAPTIPKAVLDNVSDIYKDIYQRLFCQSFEKLTEDLAYELHQAETELGMI